MVLRRAVFMLACAIAFAVPCAAETSPQPTVVNGSNGAIEVIRFAAEGTTARPAVLILHGSGGLDTGYAAYAPYAQALAASGVDAYVVGYFSRDARWPCACWDAWARTIADVTSAILRRPEADSRVGLLGFSLGGAVAVVSARDPRISALVVLAGPFPDEAQRVRIDRIPPLLVLHGDADTSVPLRDGEALVNLARQQGGRAELVVYPGAGHRISGWERSAAGDAMSRMLAFFRAELVR